MNKIKLMKDKQFLFGSIFIAANRVDTLLEKEFKRFDVTSKQWFLSIVLDNLFDSPPTIKAVAKEMGSSHQNVKQLALKLEQKGLLIFEKDKRDSRITRLKLSEASVEFWSEIRKEGVLFTKELFKEISEEDMKIARKVMQRILFNIGEIDKKNEENTKNERKKF